MLFLRKKKEKKTEQNIMKNAKTWQKMHENI